MSSQGSIQAASPPDPCFCKLIFFTVAGSVPVALNAAHNKGRYVTALSGAHSVGWGWYWCWDLHDFPSPRPSCFSSAFQLVPAAGVPCSLPMRGKGGYRRGVLSLELKAYLWIGSGWPALFYF